MLRERVVTDIKACMKAGDKPRLAVLRLVSAAIKQFEVDERREPDDTVVLGILDKMQKQRRESITQYRAAAREDLAAQEEYEISVIADFLPQPLTQSEIDALIHDAIESSGAQTMQQMGAVMAILKPQVQGRADMSALSRQIKHKLNTAS